jgi:hypothetical protein
MTTNFYFNNFPKNHITEEQLLVEDLVIEAMQIYGMDVFYLPRSSRDVVDKIYGEDTLKQYVKAYPIEVYLENTTRMDGDQDFISKFGLEIRDEITVLVSRKRFKYSTGPANLIRPNEGDLIYIPLLTGFFEITFVEHENDQAMFYTLGRGRGGNVYVYALSLKQFVFSDEIIETGITEIDEQVRDSYRRTNLPFSETGNGVRYLLDEIVYQGLDLANATAQAIVHSINYTGNNYLQVYRSQGNFVPTQIIKGNTSNAQFAMTGSYDSMSPFDDTSLQDAIDNNAIQGEGFDFIDFTETNPFGEP